MATDSLDRAPERSLMHHGCSRGAALLQLACAASIIAACTGDSVVSPAVPPDLKHSWEVAFNRGDADAIATLYAPDAQLIMSGSQVVRGRAAIRAAVSDMIRSGVQVRIGSEQNAGAGDVAYVFGPYSVLDPRGRERERGNYVEVWRRREGAWKIELDVNAVGPPVPDH